MAKNEKATRLVSCYMSDDEFEALGRECEELIASIPGAKMTRSAFLVQLYRQHRAQQSKDKTVA